MHIQNPNLKVSCTVMTFSFLRFLDHKQRRTTVSKTPLDSDQLVAETSNWQWTNIHAPGGIRTHYLSRRAAADLRLRQRGPWDRPEWCGLDLSWSMSSQRSLLWSDTKILRRDWQSAYKSVPLQAWSGPEGSRKLTHWGRVTQICIFNTRLFSLHNTLSYAIHRACLRMVLLTDVYR